MKPIRKKRLRTIGKILFFVYILFLIYFLILSDWYGRGPRADYSYNLVLFREIKRFWNYRAQVGLFVSFSNLFGNIIIFIPFGFFMPMASRYRNFLETVFYSFALSFGVEVFQLLTKVGSFDVDDMLLNTLGGMAGFIVFIICNAVRRRMDADRKK